MIILHNYSIVVRIHSKNKNIIFISMDIEHYEN